MKLGLISFLLSAVFLTSQVFAAENICIRELSPVSNIKDGTDNFIAYVAMLVEENIIGEFELRRLVEGASLISEQEARVNSAKFIHRAELERQLHANKIESAKLIEWALAQLKNKGIDKVERNETREKTVELYRRPKFNEIPAGKFRMGEDPNNFELSAEVELTKSFQMADVPVTQWLYSVVMGGNPSQFINGEYKIVKDISGQQITMQPDNPVEKVSWADAILFIEKLNKMSENDENQIYRIIPDHVKFARYALPSEAQWEYVVRNLGQANGRYGLAISEMYLEDYAWHASNSDRTTHPVAEKLPMIVNGHAFYDLLGNVTEWCLDLWSNEAQARHLLLSGKDPINVNGEMRSWRGGAYLNFQSSLKVYRRELSPPTFSYPTTGFRLIRYLP